MNSCMNHVALYLDESGAKGYLYEPEQMAGELGVASSALISAKHVSAVKSHMMALLRPYQHDGILHITDLATCSKALYAMTFSFVWSYPDSVESD